MRCYLTREGHIGAAEILTDESDAAAIKQARAVFKTKYEDRYSGFEVWDRGRLVYRYPEPSSNERPNLSGMTWRNPQAARLKYQDVEKALQEARRMRGEARMFPRGDIRELLEATADKPEALAQSVAQQEGFSKKPQ
jgi:hypothetical protein